MTAEPITREKIDEWKRLAEAVTPGPWVADTVLPAGTSADGKRSWSESPWRIVNGPPQAIQDAMLSRRAFTHAPDAAFIAASREAVPALILEVERLTAALDSERSRKEGEWRPIETAPKDGTPVLLLAPGCRDAAEGSFRGNKLPQVIGRWEYGNWVGDLVEFETGWESTGSYNVTVALVPVGWLPLPPIQQGE